MPANVLRDISVPLLSISFDTFSVMAVLFALVMIFGDDGDCTKVMLPFSTRMFGFHC